MTRVAALLTALTLAVGLGVGVNAATTTKPYTATWVSGSETPTSIGIPAGSATLTLRITNNATPQSLGSANVTPPDGYTLATSSIGTVVANTLQLRNLNLAPSASIDVILGVTTPCLAGGGVQDWKLVVKQANNFSGPPGNDFTPTGPAPSTFITGTSVCKLRFANQPNTTRTGGIIKDGFDSTGNSIKIEIYDPGTGLVVNSNAAVTLAPDQNPAGGALTFAVEDAVGGVATFPALSLDKPGPYTLRATSPAASNSPVSGQFIVADTIEQCTGTGCSFTQTAQLNTYTTTPKKGNAATFVSTLNLQGLRISCDFEPYNYPVDRQPNGVWYVYNDPSGDQTNTKTNKIVIDKGVVQKTPENGASAYRVCYASPVQFKDRFGNDAPADPVGPADIHGDVGPSTYFGTTWYIGLLPDCGNKKIPPAPCVLSWTGDSAGNRVGTFVTPPGDPTYR